MAINRVSIGSQSIKTNTDSVIEILYTEPDVNALIDPPDTPGKLVGYYDGNSDSVRLFIIDNSGLRYLKVS
jgi:hypothetical protein